MSVVFHPFSLFPSHTASLVQFFGRRRVLMAKPLLKEAGIGSIILENPFCMCHLAELPLTTLSLSVRRISEADGSKALFPAQRL